MKTALELRQERANIWEQAKALIEKAEEENRDLTAEEQEQYDRMMQDMESLRKRYERLEEQERLEAEMRQSINEPHKPNPQNPNEPEKRDSNPLAAKEYREAFWQQFRYGKNILGAEEMRSLNVGSDSAGGYMVPDEFERQLIQGLEEENIMRGYATVIQTSSGDRSIPVVTSHGQAYWAGEEKDYKESDDKFGQKTLGAHKITVLMKVSEELLNDAFFNLENYVRREFARRVGVKEEEAFISGDGVGKPRGIILDADVGKITAANNAITADELIDLFYSLKRPYRIRATWMFNDSTAKVIRKLKDNDGQYIWQPGLQAGQPDRLMGRPIAISSAMPEINAGAKVIAFGDLSFYWVADRQGRVFQRLGELYATSGQVGFRAYQRVDGALILAEAVKVMQMHV